MEISDDELKKQITEAVESATEKMGAKNRELLSEIKSARERLSALNELDIDSLQQAKKERDELARKAAEESGNWEKMFALNREETETYRKQAEQERSIARNMLADGQLKDALLDNHITNSAYLKASTAMLRDQVQFQETDGRRTVQIEGEPISEYVTKWAASETGKNFVTPPGNSGGGASNHASSGARASGPPSEEAKHFKAETWNATRQNELKKSDPTLYAQLKEQNAGELDRYVAMNARSARR